MTDTMHNLKDAFAGESQATASTWRSRRRPRRKGSRTSRGCSAPRPRPKRSTRTATSSDGRRRLDRRKPARAIAGETYEFKEMYPPMINQATAEQHKAKRMFDYAARTEEVHARLTSSPSTRWPGQRPRRDELLPVPGVRAHRGRRTAGELPGVRAKAEKFVTV